MAMVKAPLSFLKVNEGLFLPNSAKFGNAKFIKNLEGLDAVDVVFLCSFSPLLLRL